MPLNIDWQQILLHLFNFIVLFAILYFLLYKPVKQFMDKRTEYYKKLDEEAKQKLADAEKAKEEYARRLSAVDSEIAEIKEKERRELEEAKATRLKRAQEEADKIVRDAREDIEQERARMIKEAQTEISDCIVSATEKIVLQSSTSESYEQFLAAVERGENNEQKEEPRN